VNIGAPVPIPTKYARKFPLPAWYLPNGTKYASDDQLEKGESSCERWGIGCGVLVVIAVIVEFVIAAVHPPYDSLWEIWGSSVADALIALGIVGEVLFGMWNNRIQTELRKRSNDKLGAAEKEAAEANARAAESLKKAEEEYCARVKLEANLQPRSLNQEQWNLIRQFKDKLPSINIGYETDAETWRYACQFRDALRSAGISVGMYSRTAGVNNWGMLIYEPNGFDGARARTVKPIVEVIRKSDIAAVRCYYRSSRRHQSA